MKRHKVRVNRMISMPHQGTYRCAEGDEYTLEVSNIGLELKKFYYSDDLIFIQVTPEGAEQLKGLLALYEIPYGVFNYPIIKSDYTFHVINLTDDPVEIKCEVALPDVSYAINLLIKG